MNFIKNILNNNNNNIIEPLTCLIRLAMLNYEKENTKIGIYNNKILIYSPHFFQGAIRKLYRESRDNLHNLCNPIQKSILWYNIDCKEIKYIVKLSILGLKKLKLSYEKESIINHSLDRYINILELKLNESNNNNDNNNYNISTNHFILIENIENCNELTKIGFYKALVSIWTFQTIQTIYNLLNELEIDEIKYNGFTEDFQEQFTKNKKLTLIALDTLLDYKEQLVNQIVLNNSTIL